MLREFQFENYTFHYIDCPGQLHDILDHLSIKFNWVKYPVHHPMYVPYKYAIMNAYATGYSYDDAKMETYIMGYIYNVHGKSQGDYLDFLENFYKHIKFSVNLQNPQNPVSQNPQNVLTYTKFCYGMLTFSTKTNNNYTGADKMTRQQGIDYLKNIYERYFNPQNPRNRTQDFECNFWIEEIVSSAFIHAHVFYKRKKGHLYAGKNWLKINKVITCNINHAMCKTDEHIRNDFNYVYDDPDSVVVHEYPKQVLCLE